MSDREYAKIRRKAAYGIVQLTLATPYTLYLCYLAYDVPTSDPVAWLVKVGFLFIAMLPGIFAMFVGGDSVTDYGAFWMDVRLIGQEADGE